MSTAFELGLDHLTETEQRLFDTLYEQRGRFVGRGRLCEAAFGAAVDDGRLHPHLTRLRHKLAGTQWRVQRSRAYGAYRLMAAPDSAPVT